MAQCQPRLLSGTTVRAVLQAVAVVLAGAAVAPASESVVDELLPLASLPRMLSAEARVRETADQRSAETASLNAVRETLAVPEAARSQCPGCARERLQEQLGEAQMLAEMRRWRVQSFGRQMLSSLGLTQPPQMPPATLAALRRSPPVLPDEVLTDAGIGVDRSSAGGSEGRNRKGHFYVFKNDESPPECSARQLDEGRAQPSKPRACMAFNMASLRQLSALDSVQLELFVYYASTDATRAPSLLPRVRLAGDGGGELGEIVSESVKESSVDHHSGSGGGASDGRWLHVELSRKAQLEALRGGGRLVLELTCGGGSAARQLGASNDTETNCEGDTATLSGLDSRKPFIRVTDKSSAKEKRNTYHTTTCEEMERARDYGEAGGSGGAGSPWGRRRPCCLEKLRVNFHRDLNYTFVAHPIEYDINFCRGSCVEQGPAYKRLYTHSVMAEYVAQQRQLSDIYVPCCSPAQLTGLSIIVVMADGVYRDVVLPNMSVAACGCT